MVSEEDQGTIDEIQRVIKSLESSLVDLKVEEKSIRSDIKWYKGRLESVKRGEGL